MAPDDADAVLLAVWCVGVGGAALALCCLLLELQVGRRCGRTAAGIAFLGLFACCGLLVRVAGRPASVCGPIAVLAMVSLMAWAAHSPAVARIALRLANPRAIWALLLIASPAYAIFRTCGLNDPGGGFAAVKEVILSRNEVAGLRLRTDRGGELRLYHLVVSGEAQRAEEDWIAGGRLECRVIRTGEIDPASNCHGWVFTEGRYALRSEDVDQVLSDNGYRAVDAPNEDDLVVYRSRLGEILHTGLVRYVATDGMVLVESKWGPLGRFLHPPECQPYGTLIAYYRSRRRGHQLQVVRLPLATSPSTPRPEAPSAAAIGVAGNSR